MYLEGVAVIKKSSNHCVIWDSLLQISIERLQSTVKHRVEIANTYNYGLLSTMQFMHLTVNAYLHPLTTFLRALWFLDSPVDTSLYQEPLALGMVLTSALQFVPFPAISSTIA